MYATVPKTTPASVINRVALASWTPPSGAVFAKAEIEHLHPAASIDHDIGRLEMPVHDALLVRGPKRIRHGNRYRVISDSGRPVAAADSGTPSTSSMVKNRTFSMSSTE